jgi:hypothetical protein
LGLTQSFQLEHPLLPVILVEAFHQLAGGFIIHTPQAGDNALGTGDLKCALQAKNAFAGGDLAQARLTSRRHGHLDLAQIELGYFQSRKNAVVLSRRRWLIGAGGHQAAEQPGMKTGDPLLIEEVTRGAGLAVAGKSGADFGQGEKAVRD